MENRGNINDSLIGQPSKELGENVTFNISNNSQFPTLKRGQKSVVINKKQPILIDIARSPIQQTNGSFLQTPTPTVSSRESVLSARGNGNGQVTIPSIPGAPEILFFKRLLYLKASIDGEATLKTFSALEKTRGDMASPDLMLFGGDT